PSAFRHSRFAHFAGNCIGHLSRGVRRSFYLSVGSLALALVLLLVTQPFSLFAQAIFVFLLWSAAMAVRRMPGQLPVLMLMVLSLTVSCRYLWWRYTSTLNYQ